MAEESTNMPTTKMGMVEELVLQGNGNAESDSSEPRQIPADESFEDASAATNNGLTENTEASIADEEVEIGEEGAELDAESEEENQKFEPAMKKGPLEYDLKYMYPELDLLVNKKRREWNFSDPSVIRAIWLESKTHVLADWKPKFSKIQQRKKPEIPVQLNYAAQLRNEFRQQEKEKEQIEIAGIPVGRDAPYFGEIKLPTTSTAQMRYKLIRDNPPVPEYFIHHYAKFRKPPFLKYSLFGKQCKNIY